MNATSDILCHLATRIEQEAPSEALHRAIAEALGWQPSGERWTHPDRVGAQALPAWLTSIDAADTLRLAGWRVEVVLDGAMALCGLLCPPDPIDLLRLQIRASAATEARARSAAGLRALGAYAAWPRPR
jgi:hypothetical protein